MGGAQSSETVPRVPQPIYQTRRERRHEEPTAKSFDEKFDALRIDHTVSPSVLAGSLLSHDDASVSGAKVEQYVQEVLKDRKVCHIT